MGVSVRTARRAARDLDRRRAHFDRTMHRANANDPHNYDLVLDTHSLGLEIAAEVVVQTIEIGRTVAPEQDAGLHARPEPAYSKPESTAAAAGARDEPDGPPAAAGSAIPLAVNPPDSDENRELPFLPPP